MLITPTQLPSPIPNSGYLLIEPSNLSTELKELLPVTHACVPPFLWAAEDSMPRLLPLSKLTLAEEKVVSRLLEQEAFEEYPPVVCAWLHSEKSTEELTNSIARMIFGRAPDGEQVIWRYYDPRVFIITANLFTEEQAHALVGAVERWIFPWCKQWWCVERTQPFLPSTADLDLGWPTSAQWDLLRRSEVLDRLYTRLHKEGSPPTFCIDDLNHAIAAFLETASYLHLDSDEERAEFSYFSTRYRKFFQANHELIPKLSQLRNREITLRQMMASITAEDIQFMEGKINEARRMV